MLPTAPCRAAKPSRIHLWRGGRLGVSGLRGGPGALKESRAVEERGPRKRREVRRKGRNTAGSCGTKQRRKLERNSDFLDGILGLYGFCCVFRVLGLLSGNLGQGEELWSLRVSVFDSFGYDLSEFCEVRSTEEQRSVDGNQSQLRLLGH